MSPNQPSQQPTPDQLNEPLHLTIISAEGTVYNQDVKAISSTNDTGDFDILGYHANFISIIQKKVIVHQMDGSLREFPVEVAVLKAISNKVEIFLGIERVELDKEKDEKETV
jgi:F0F1-type ATP synthase epsilon subunit